MARGVLENRDFVNNVNVAMDFAAPENDVRSTLKDYMQLYLIYGWICLRLPLQKQLVKPRRI